ncbi:MAG: UbiA family prenyltransferase [Acetobacteraceae bacterium]|nr:UbiA family prenyltransferase [Acetobacteraceae bacterium]
MTVQIETGPVAPPLASSPDGAPLSLPLCVDMDGSLLRIDTLHEAALAAACAGPRALLRLLGALRDGKAAVKAAAAETWSFDPATLPYSAALLALIETERAAGRRIVLCTAAHRRIAERIAAHLGLFDEVIATEGGENLRGPRKAARLVERFGRGGFLYAGNDATDLAVWAESGGAVVVNAPGAVLSRARALAPVSAVLRDAAPGAGARAALRALRPHQWLKNALCLVPPLAAGDLGLAAWAGALTVMVAFCLTASAIYVVNDLSDLAADRAHPRKSRRPFASGALSAKTGMLMAPALLLGGLLLGWLAGALPILIAYAVLSVAYSLALKEQPLVDVFALAALYTIRLFGGGEASGHPVSLWLLSFSAFIFLSLALIKRVAELDRLQKAKERRASRRGYAVEDAPILQSFGSAATFASAVVLLLYIQSDTASRTYAAPAALWGAVPLLLFWQCRLWISTARGYMHDDPIVYASRDWVSWAVLACLGAVVALAWAGLPGWPA